MRALYAGSFDPVTFGHVDIVRRCARMFDDVVVGIGHNPKKRGRFSPERRKALFEAEVSDLDGVRVVVFEGLVAHAAEHHEVDVLVRGVRGPSDMDLETRNALGNQGLTGIETLFLIARPELSFVSSSLVKEIAAHGGDVGSYVSKAVQHALVHG